MANLSERLREGSAGLTAYCLGDEVEPVIDVALPAYLNSAADLIDRLTVEGLAGVLERLSWEYGAKLVRGEVKAGDRSTFMAEGLRDYITTPSVEESHD